ncbi:NUDIX domain-containing protein [Candidatus Micrarchaeota archaeon]|nr:NUDIX domain-containing protein [Candidatus Micrarchaeota archaeon]
MILLKIQELNSYVVLFNRDRLLLLKRKNGIWEFPGGQVEWGEGPEKSAVRETREETGLVPKNLKLLTITSATYEKEGNQKHSVYIVYQGESDGDNVTLSGEHEECRWLTLTEAGFMKNLGLNAEAVLEVL